MKIWLPGPGRFLLNELQQDSSKSLMILAQVICFIHVYYIDGSLWQLRQIQPNSQCPNLISFVRIFWMFVELDNTGVDSLPSFCSLLLRTYSRVSDLYVFCLNILRPLLSWILLELNHFCQFFHCFHCYCSTQVCSLIL